MKHSDGCGIQCISYISGMSADKVRDMASCNYPSHLEVLSILRKLKLKVATPFRSTIFPDNKYIVTVPSLNNKGEFHFVVIWCNNNKYGFCGKVQVYDPVVNPDKKKYVSQTKRFVKKNEFKILSWTSLIQINYE